MQVMNIKNMLLKLFSYVFIIVFGYIFIDTLCRPSQQFAKMNPFIVLILAILLVIGMIKLSHLFEKVNRKRLLFISGCSLAVMISLQLFFIYFFKVTPLWDFGTVYESAINSLQGFETFDSYFYNCYPNNIPLFIFMSSIMHFLNNMGVTDFYTSLMYVNISFVVIALISMYVFIYRRYGIEKATLFSLFSLLVTPFYSYSTIIYTDTLSMLFPIIGILLYDFFYHTKSNKRYVFLVCLTFVLTIGTLMKMNVVILMVGMIIHYFMTQKSLKGIGFAAILVGSFLLMNTSYNKAIQPYIPIDMDQMGYPTTHWIMMGLKGNGSYNGDDDAFTGFLKEEYHLAQEDIVKEHLNVIEQRLKDYGLIGFLGHMRYKVNFTWADGTYYAPDKLMRHPLKESLYQQYVFGENNQVFVYLSQVSHLVMLFLILVGGLSLLKTSSFESVISITIFGVILFLMIWETRSRYLVLFIPMMLSFACFGFIQLEKITTQVIDKRKNSR